MSVGVAKKIGKVSKGDPGTIFAGAAVLGMSLVITFFGLIPKTKATSEEITSLCSLKDCQDVHNDMMSQDEYLEGSSYLDNESHTEVGCCGHFYDEVLCPNWD